MIVSSGAVTQPNSPVYKFLNLFGNIMAEKIVGEDRVRALYAAQPDGGLGYTIVRPGGLTLEPARGAAALELNQGDTKSGRISRADVAALCVECVGARAASRATFECYEADTAKPLQTVGVSNILKQRNAEGAPAFVSGRECRGDSYGALFAQLEPDGAPVAA